MPDLVPTFALTRCLLPSIGLAKHARTCSRTRRSTQFPTYPNSRSAPSASKRWFRPRPRGQLRKMGSVCSKGEIMEATPRFLNGVYPFEGQGYDKPFTLGAKLAYAVPPDKRAQLIYLRAGNSSGEL